MQLIGLILDGLILVLLAFTVFFAGKLSLALKNFREGKKDFANLLSKLSEATNQAESSIRKLQKATDDSGHDLQMRINQAKALSEELQFMTEAANNLADRLEGMAAKNREIAGRIERAAGIGGEPLDLGSDKDDKIERMPDSAGNKSGFMIKDKELSASKQKNETREYGSRAEEELARAIRNRKKQ